MNEKRYFYRDPLEAAYMAKHFGMEFQRGDQCVVGWSDFVELEYCRWDAPFYIHPESLHLLDPQVRDLCQFKCGNNHVNWARIANIALNISFSVYPTGARRFDKFLRIIQRDGQPFFWPESEET